MDHKQILRQFMGELDERTNYYSYIGSISEELVLIVRPYDYCSAALIFCVRNDLIVLVKERYNIGQSHKIKSCNSTIGEITVENIIDTVKLFVECGRINKNGLSMNNLLSNNRFLKTKSARCIE